MTCFVCNLPILSHQVGLTWQGGNGVDDLLREQMEMDIIRGRLGGNLMAHRDSSAQITTIETSLDDLCATPPSGVAATAPAQTKRRRSSLAQLTDLLSGLSKSKSNPRRGTLADLGKSFGGVGSNPNSGAGRRMSARPSHEAGPTDFMSKVRKRRETSADITVLRKGSIAGAAAEAAANVVAGTAIINQTYASDIRGDLSR